LVVTETHQIMRDEVLFASLPKDVDLCLLEVDVGIRSEPGKIQREAGVWRVSSTEGNGDLRPIAIRVTPKDRSPALIYFLQRPIAFIQPLAKGTSTYGAVAAVAKFVVDLPADYGWMLGIMVGHAGDNTLHVFPIDGVVRAIFAAVTVGDKAPISAH